MIRRIVVPLDGSEAARDALPEALAIARGQEAAVDLAHVHDVRPLAGVVALTGGPPPMEGDRDTMADRYARLAAQLADESGLRVRAILLEGPTVPALHAHLRATKADLVVMTIRSRHALASLAFGAVVEDLASVSDVPILAIRPRLSAPRRGQPVFNRILIPLDGSGEGEVAIDAAIALGRPNGTSFVLVTVADPTRPGGAPASGVTADPVGLTGELTAEDRRAHAYLARLANSIQSERGLRVTFHLVVHGTPAEAILDVARDHAVDLIAVATRGHSGPDVRRLGGAAVAILRNASCSVLLVPPTISDPHAL
jgi:nucleotide-binding universal stress UspA family protein